MSTIINVELHLSAEHQKKLEEYYKIANVNEFYDNFQEFLNECMNFRALHHILDSAERLAEWSKHFEHLEQT